MCCCRYLKFDFSNVDNILAIVVITNKKERDVAPWEERSLMVRWVVGLILHGGPIELFLVPPSAPRLVYQRPWYVLSCLLDDAYKRTLAANRKEQPMWRQRVSSLAI